ncbi:MAG: alanyl-tRNA synthetase [Candidatus Doudnabacteria bacterium Gr01-1014_77]|uniref:Alanine--tRNA ligase n=1 Tax=Candidatus Doudnabacteria bacterium Gr01-1014_77 TaxID=2017133 RepID=A0A554JBZ7_9BACT|nr:MAG: alanyl-tRNA synthetase [Candidatus Doudnabacteria bacterium Gr01-1014_77]
MKRLTAQQLRQSFLTFFEGKGHTIIPSAPLVPQNDPTVLFTTAGMHPLVPYLLGENHPGGKRVVDVQKCVRTTDIDDVGDNRHLTFFEMLGNWSFGDYFKEDAITWSFEFLTSKDWMDLDPNQLYVSVFAGDDDVPRDDEAIDSWKKAFATHPTKPISAEFSEDVYAFGGANRIFPYNREKNWWQAGDKGPAGPDTEMFIDTEGDLPENMRVKHNHWIKLTGSSERCHINCDCGRFIEVWNNVFMQYNGLGGGKYEPLAQPNVDTGMGLERVLTFSQGQTNVFDTELFKSAFDVIYEQVEETTNLQEDKARIIVDHLRAATFMAADGVVPSNKERGYIMRRILRRAIVHGKMFGMKGDWVEKIVSKYIAEYSIAYPELEQNKRNILNVILEEEQKFGKTLEAGLKEFRKYEQVTGKDAFNLFQSFGIPWEITKELALQSGMSVNKEEFEEEFKKHQELSRTASAGTFKGGLADHSEVVVRMHTATHLLQAALRKVLGDTVSQKGSNITPERLRFDFTHPEKMTPEQISEVEKIVNENIARDLKVTKEIMTPEQARNIGAIGLFGEKYGDTVSIYSILDPATNDVVSREFCGGPHVEHTGEIGKFKIAKEEAVSAGVRRIKAIVE